MNAIQYDLFDEVGDDVAALQRTVDEVKASCEKTRKGMFVRHNELGKMMMNLHERLDIIERNICQFK